MAAKKPASGMYNSKARNLTDAQLKRAGGAKAAAKRTVDVSATKRETTGANKGYTLGPGGKRLTGTVTMANGDRAVYKDGKRVTNAPKASDKPAAKKITGGRDKDKAKTTGMTDAQKAKLIKDKKLTPAVINKVNAKKMGSEGPKKSKPTALTPKGKKFYEQGGGGLAGKNSPLKGLFKNSAITKGFK